MSKFEEIWVAEDLINIPFLRSEENYGRIQWKGTDVCIDIHCQACGEHSHLDGDFCYFIECGHCGTRYEMSPYIKLIPTEKVHPKHCATRVTEP